MKRVNISSPDFEYDPEDPDGFRAGRYQPGFGAKRTGTSLYEIPPGQSVCPYHYEWGEEEWVLVLEGRPTLRHPEGSDALEPLDLVFFPRGPEGAHAVRNDTDSTVRVLMWSDFVQPSATVYPDSDKIGIWTDPERTDSVMVRRSSNVDYYDGET